MTAPSQTFKDALAELVAIPSVSSVDPALDMSNQPIVDRLANWLGDLGFRIEQHDVPGQAGKVNLIARAGRGRCRPGSVRTY